MNGAFQRSVVPGGTVFRKRANRFGLADVQAAAVQGNQAKSQRGSGIGVSLHQGEAGHQTTDVQDQVIDLECPPGARVETEKPGELRKLRPA